MTFLKHMLHYSIYTNFMIQFFILRDYTYPSIIYYTVLVLITCAKYEELRHNKNLFRIR